MMKRFVAFVLCIPLLVLSLSSCRKGRDAYLMLSEFLDSYGAEGVIYSPTVQEGEEGYVYEGLIEKIYVFSGDFPDNYAIFLNSHPDFSSECALFICSDATMVAMVEEMCIERIGLLCVGDERSFVKRSGDICFYSTMSDRNRAEKIFSEIIR